MNDDNPTAPAETLEEAVRRIDKCFELAGESIAQKDWLRVKASVRSETAATTMTREQRTIVYAFCAAVEGMTSKTLTITKEDAIGIAGALHPLGHPLLSAAAATPSVVSASAELSFEDRMARDAARDSEHFASLPSSSGAKDEAVKIVERHRRHVEQSPGAGREVQNYALVVCDDIISDLARLSTPSATGDMEYVHKLEDALLDCASMGLANMIAYCGAFETFNAYKREQYEKLREFHKIAQPAWDRRAALDSRGAGT